MDNPPELRPNQFGISCKTLVNHGPFKLVDEILYFTVNPDTISMELYPKQPIIIIDRDAIEVILKKIAENKPKPKTINRAITDERFGDRHIK